MNAYVYFALEHLIHFIKEEKNGLLQKTNDNLHKLFRKLKIKLEIYLF